MTAGDALVDAGTCTMATENPDCEEYAEYYCCVAGGEDDEDECPTDPLMLDYISKFEVIGSKFEHIPITLQATKNHTTPVRRNNMF